ncbi:MAG: polyketide synthase [Pseudonocardiales bacterium]|nr:MAG: polyketide synthase [Pseudonocardiales bacterium]
MLSRPSVDEEGWAGPDVSDATPPNHSVPGPTSPSFPIAIVGLAGRFPGAPTVAKLWQALRHGTELIHRSDLDAQRGMGVPEAVLSDPRFVAASPVLDGIDMFDAAFFDLTPREAELRDPQHRLFLETAHSALEHAGCDPARARGRIGVFAGVKENDYLASVLRADPGLDRRLDAMALGVANDHDFVATFTSYALDLRGPSMTVNSACSTSLVAVHVACRALAAGDCELALAGAVSVEVPSGRGYLYREGGVHSPDGHCRPFSAAAAGTLWGSGVAVVVLKPLAAALADRDTVHAVLLGSAVTNDGAAKSGFTAPSEDGQAAAVSGALADAGVDPRTVSYVEAHGTATKVGDPVEVAALTRAYGSASGERQWCLLGSVKSNMGHLVAAAGMAGLVKTVLALEHEMIPPTLYADPPAPLIDFAGGPFRLATKASPWSRAPGVPRRAGVSSTGIGGTNAHVILEEAPEVVRGRWTTPWQLLPVSAKTPAARDAVLARLGAHLRAHPEADLGDVARTLQVGRAQHKHRAVLVAANPVDAAVALATPEGGRVRSVSSPATPPRVALLFSGLGSQHPGMGRGLYETWPTYKDVVDRCAELLAKPLGTDLRDVLWSGSGERLQEAWLTQPALFTVEYALAELWRSWGVRPAAVVGHSIGEYVAATVAGVFTLPDALAVVAARGRLMQAMPPGAMLAVGLAEDEVAPSLPAGLSIAVVNGPGTCVVSGPTETIEGYAADLGARSVVVTRLRASHATHSAMMDPVLEEFASVVAAVPRATPQLPFLSNLSGAWITPEDATSPDYWARHLRGTVRFAQCVTTLAGSDPNGWALVEAGPGRVLADLARRQLPPDAPVPLATLPPARDAAVERDCAAALDALGELWLRGVPVEWDTVAGPERFRVPLPTYPFQRQRHWADAPAAVTSAAVAADNAAIAGVGSVTRVAPVSPERFAIPGWRQAAPVVDRLAADTAGPWLMITAADSPGDRLADRLVAAGARVVRVRPGTGFEWPAADEVVVDPAVREDWVWLLDGLASAGRSPRRIVDAIGLDSGLPEETNGVPATAFGTLVRLVALGQALADRRQLDPVELTVLTAGAQDVHGGDLVAPALATVAGPCRTLPLEVPSISCRHVDTDRPAAPVTVQQLVVELGDPTAEPVVALRRGRRWVPSTEQVELPEGDPAAGWRPGGVWLITGGFGRTGLAVAEHLARRSSARIVLVGQSLPAAGVAEAERRIVEAGGEVLIRAADITDPSALRAVREETLTRFGAMHGIIHAARVSVGALIEATDVAQMAAALAPKVSGTLALAEVFGDLPLDAFVLCSSTLPLTGGIGQVDDTAAYAFLDAYARSAQLPVASTVSIGWDGDLPSGGLTPVERAEALRRVLAAGLGPHLLAGALPSVQLGGVSHPAPEAEPAGGADGSQVPPVADRDGLGDHAPPRTDLERQIVTVWSEVLRVAVIGVEDDFFALGGDSLTAVQIVWQVGEVTGRRLTMQTLYDVPTVAGMAAALDANPPGAVSTAVAEAEIPVVARGWS